MGQALGVLPEDIFPEVLMQWQTARRYLEIGLNVAELESFAAMERRLVRERAVPRLLEYLTPLQRTTIVRRFGLDGRAPATSAEIGLEVGLGDKRIRQIQAEALGILRHPVRLRRSGLSRFGEEALG